ncbi:MAG: phosphoribosylformylglycinamidine synthase subunit PurS [Candidatus Solibacter usitatus]|nr:phosphoribosylformylglycinamidine synthase subunit PurS [Candidatus Solibacter usitatus]
MTFRVHVSLKTTVLDPQGQTIGTALRGHGHKSIADVRQGKYFDIQVADGVEREAAEAEIRQIAGDVLANPVIEEFRVECIE